MIQTFHIQAPLNPAANPDAAISSLTAYVERLQKNHPALQGARLEHSEGLLHIRLRVYAIDRWRAQRAARLIGSIMLRRIKINPGHGVMELEETAPPATRLTKAQGRVSRPRQSQTPQA